MPTRGLCTEIPTPNGPLRCTGSYNVIGIEQMLIHDDYALYPLDGIDNFQLQGRCEERRGLFFIYHAKLLVPSMFLDDPRAKLIVTVFPDAGEYPKCSPSVFESQGSQRAIPVWKARQYNGAVPISRNPAPITFDGKPTGVRIKNFDQVRAAYDKRGWLSFGDTVQVVCKNGRSTVEIFEPTPVYVMADIQWRRLHEIYSRETIIEDSVRGKTMELPMTMKVQEMQTVPPILPSRGRRYSLYHGKAFGDH